MLVSYTAGRQVVRYFLLLSLLFMTCIRRCGWLGWGLHAFSSQSRVAFGVLNFLENDMGDIPP